MTTMASRPCPQCGNPIHPQRHGRPKEYCTTSCRRLHQVIQDLWKLTEEVTTLDKEHRAKVRRELFAVGNAFTLTNKET